jgi:hypothetical protein
MQVAAPNTAEGKSIGRSPLFGTVSIAVLIAAKRDGARVAVHAVDPDITGLKTLRRTQRVRDVSGPADVGAPTSACGGRAWQWRVQRSEP